MSREVLIGLDAGTSVIKAVAFDLSGRAVAQASRRNSYDTARDGTAEQDMARTWDDTAAVLRELGEAVPDLERRALGIGITGQGDGTWLVDADGEPCHKGWLWLDARAAPAAREIVEGDAHGAIYEATGSGVNVCQMRSQLRQMRRDMPELLDRAASAFHCKDWLYFRLTGERATDPSEALFTFGDFRTRGYSEDVIRALELGADRDLLPPIVDGAERTHPLSAEAAAATGLPEGLPVALGYVDVICSAIAGGLHDADLRPGLSLVGSTGMHMRFAGGPGDVVLNADRSGYTMAFPGGAFAQMQTNMAASVNIDWMLGLARECLAASGVERQQAELLDGLDDRILAARPGAALFHPYILSSGERGPFAEPRARASFTGLDQDTGWFDMMRAVFDGLALAARDCYGAMGPVPGEIRIAGGAARSGAFRRLLASALDRPVRGVSQTEAGAAGAAMIAGLALGTFADMEAAVAAWVTPLLGDAVAPDADLARALDAMFDAYLATRHALVPAWAAQAEMRAALS